MSAAATPEPRPLARPGRPLLLAGLLLLAAAFVALALTRRLNFDEALALRAGWLLVHGIAGEPSFLMPTTLLLGAAGSLVADPGWLFPALRLAVALPILALAWWAWRIDAGPATAALAGLVTLSNATFVVHAAEFRYDAALLAAWLAGYGLVRRRRPADFVLLGLLVAWLASHHLKGVLFAGALLGLAALAAWLEPARHDRLLRLAAGAAIGAVAWILLAALLGRAAELGEVYSTFFDLAASGAKVWPWEALAGTVRRDAAWWLLALAAAVAALLRRRPRDARGAFADDASWDLAFALLPLALLFLHPHPWAYQTAPAAPFLAILVARTVRRSGLGPGRVAAAAAGLVVVQLALTGTTPWTVYRTAAAAPMASQVDSLRRLREAAAPGDRVIDPSGLAYFLPPCVEQWYLDTLFREPAARGEWMAELATADLGACPWMLNTYRLQMLPPPLQQRLRGSYALLPGGGGLALHRADPRLAALAASEPLGHDELLSFW